MLQLLTVVGQDGNDETARRYGPWEVRLGDLSTGRLERETLTEPARHRETGQRALVAWVSWPEPPPPEVRAGLDGLRMELHALWERRGELEHPRLVPWLGFGEHEGPWFAMGHRPGMPLRELWKGAARVGAGNVEYVLRDYERGNEIFHESCDGQAIVGVHHRTVRVTTPPLPVRYAVRIVADAAEGLARLHERGVAHGALSLDRIWVADDGPVYVSHVGAYLAERALDLLGTTNRTTGQDRYRYASPEQLVAGTSPDARSDVFVLGVILYELLTFCHLFCGKGLFDLTEQVASADIAPPARLNPAVGPYLDRLVMQALSREPDHRFQSAGAFRRALLEEVDDMLPCGATDVAALVHRAKRAPRARHGRIAFW